MLVRLSYSLDSDTGEKDGCLFNRVVRRDQPKAEAFRFLLFRKAQKLNRNVSAFRLLSAERGVSAERLSFCRNTLFLQKCYCISAESFRPRCFCRNQPFCRNLPLSAETPSFCRNLLLPAERQLFLSITAFSRNLLLSVSTLSVSVDL